MTEQMEAWTKWLNKWKPECNDQTNGSQNITTKQMEAWKNRNGHSLKEILNEFACYFYRYEPNLYIYDLYIYIYIPIIYIYIYS